MANLQSPTPGAIPTNSDETWFRVWAPRAGTAQVEIHGKFVPLEKLDQGYFAGSVKGARAGDRYRLQLDHNTPFPDPASRYQPQGVHGPSEIVSPNSYQWEDSAWTGVNREALAIYEIHVGTFTKGGTFRSAIHRLDELVELGVTALEIMPVAEAPGRWNWGYDGVNLYAPSHNYGKPDDLKALVDACHRRGLAVILDVVYNHIGPEGNYLANFGPYFSKKHRTPWGEAFNFDEEHSAEVRHFIRNNVRYWIEEFHLDGLRLDAVRLMFDNSQIPIVDEIGRDVAELQETTRRKLHLIGESNVYDPGLLQSNYDAIWIDEIPHAILSLVLNQVEVAQREYRGMEDLQRCLDKGYLYQWEEGKIDRCDKDNRGRIGQIIQGLQTHDHVGNHPLGLRLSAQASPAAQRAAAALILLYPSIPFIFMGEEFATPSPFCFFVDFGDHWLRKAVVEGRKRDYEHHNWTEFISPLDKETFRRSKLPPATDGDALTLQWYRNLLYLRKEWLGNGSIDADQMKISSDPERQLIILSYPSAWVAVRLGEPAATADKIALNGTILFHSSGDNQAKNRLGINEAAVGLGKLKV